jgi:hypothetical protein
MGKYPEVYISIGKLPLKLANMRGDKPMFWPDIFLSLRRVKATKQSRGRQNNSSIESDYIWIQIHISHETDRNILIVAK